MAGYLQFTILCLAAFVTLSECKVSPELQLTLPHGGGITGKYMTSFSRRGIRAFLGVPYAEPPVDDLRFKAPSPKIPWSGFIPTNVDNKACPQGMGFSQTQMVLGDEDCLYVNVYAPLEPKTNGPLPVMFFIHGGAFHIGNGGAPLYTPEFILDHDVILVSGNYRLGALGFLSVGSAEIPGNFGLKDQSFLLQWVQDNIATFGGDPNQVTIFGESAGAASVAYHMISPLSHMKFHKAILQSGVQYAPWAFDYNGNSFKNAVALGKELNCSLTQDKASHETYLSCLKSKSTKEIILASTKLLDIAKDFLTPFLPVAEEGMEGFISKQPNEYRRSHGLDIPILIGVTSQEGVFKTAMSYAEDAWNTMNIHMDSFINQLYVGGYVLEVQRTEIRKLVKDFYFKNGQFERNNPMNTTDFFSDSFFVSPMDEFLWNRLKTNTNSAATFVYLYAHRAAISTTDLFPVMMGLPEVDKDLGVCHGDDLFSLFPANKNMVSNIVPNPIDGAIQKTVTDMWVNFAKTGNPTNTESPVVWSPTTKYPLEYLRIGNFGEADKDIIAMEKGFLEQRMALWRQIKGFAAFNKVALEFGFGIYKYFNHGAPGGLHT